MLYCKYAGTFCTFVDNDVGTCAKSDGRCIHNDEEELDYEDYDDRDDSLSEY